MVKMYFKRVKRIQYGRAVNNLEVSADKKFITVWHMLWFGRYGS